MKDLVLAISTKLLKIALMSFYCYNFKLQKNCENSTKLENFLIICFELSSKNLKLFFN